MTVLIFKLPEYIIAAPHAVFLKMMSSYIKVLAYNALITTTEIILGFLMATIAGIFISIIIVYSKIGRIILAWVFVAKVMPKIIFIPTILLSLGQGIFAKCIVVSLVCFFPIVVSLVKGLLDTNNDILDLCETYKMKKSEIFWKVKLPNALPAFFIGLKIAFLFSISGALVAEFYLAESGLGYIIWLGGSYYEMDTVYSGIVILIGISLFFYGSIIFLERKVVFWKENVKEIYI